MEFLLNNWWLIILGIAIGAVGAYTVYVFVKLPTNAQLAKVREWLLYAVAEAEKELGSGTGQLKLRYVYDMFILRFSALANLITFEAFSLMVDDALDTFREMLDQNESVQSYVNKE